MPDTYEFTIVCEVQAPAEVEYAEKDTATITVRLKHYGTKTLKFRWVGKVAADAVNREVLERLGEGEKVELRIQNATFTQIPPDKIGTESAKKAKLRLPYQGAYWMAVGEVEKE